MSVQVSVVMLGVADVERAKRFYVDGLGCELTQDFPGFVRCRAGGADLALYPWDAVASDADLPPQGSGFRGVSLHYLAENTAEVDAAMRAAEAAGATVVKPATKAQWGGYFGYFTDPDGHLWRVVTN